MHSFVLGLELRIQYTYTRTILSPIDFELDAASCTYLALFAGTFLVSDTNTHTCKFSWLTHSNAIRIHIRQIIVMNSICIYSRCDSNSASARLRT